MAQWNSNSNSYLASGTTLFEVPMIANKNGQVVAADNPFPVTIGSGGTSGGTITSKPWGLDIAQGNIAGHTFIHKFGATPAMSQNTTGSIWDKSDTPYPWSAFSTANTVSISTTAVNGSTVTTDDGVSVTISGLDENYASVTETLTISGSTATGSQLFKRVFRAFADEDNTSQIRMSVNTTEIARINIGKAQTLMAVYTIPAGYTGYLMQGVCSVQYGADATGDMFVRYFGQNSFRVGHSFEVSGAGGPYRYPFQFPVAIPEKSDIDVRATVRSNNARITAAFDMLLIAD